MKCLLLTSAATLFCSFALTAHSQAYSGNVVGYYRVTLSAGNNWIANQLDAGPGANTLDNVLVEVPDGSTFTKWDPVANQFLPLSVFDGQSQLWSIDYSFNLFEGGVLHSPIAGQNTFVGTLNQDYFLLDVGFQHQNYPHFAPGLYLLACPDPVGGVGFADVVGRAPQNGEWVQILDPATQSLTTTTFDALSGTWDHGAPTLAVGQAAFFDLGPVAVPEPSALALTGLGAVLAFYRRGRGNASRGLQGR